MKIIKINLQCPDVRELYEKADTKEQRALLGLMVKTGRTKDAVYCAAFNLLCDIQAHNGIYVLSADPNMDSSVANDICLIAEAAMNGVYRKYTMSNLAIVWVLCLLRDV